MRRLLGWLTIPLLAACAASGPQWEKPGAGQAAIDDDVQKCRVEARLFATPQPEPAPQSTGTPMADRGQERDAQELQKIRSCMEGKGYSFKR